MTAVANQSASSDATPSRSIGDPTEAGRLVSTQAGGALRHAVIRTRSPRMALSFIAGFINGFALVGKGAIPSEPLLPAEFCHGADVGRL